MTEFRDVRTLDRQSLIYTECIPVKQCFTRCFYCISSKLSTLVAYFAWIFLETSSREHRGRSAFSSRGFLVAIDHVVLYILRKVHPSQPSPPSPRSSFCGIPIISGKALAAKVIRPQVVVLKNLLAKGLFSSLILVFQRPSVFSVAMENVCQGPKKIQMTPLFWRIWICFPKNESTHQKRGLSIYSIYIRLVYICIENISIYTSLGSKY